MTERLPRAGELWWQRDFAVDVVVRVLEVDLVFVRSAELGRVPRRSSTIMFRIGGRPLLRPLKVFRA